MHNISYDVLLLMLVASIIYALINNGISYELISICLVMIFLGFFMLFKSLCNLPKKLYITVRPLEIVLNSEQTSRNIIHIEKSNIKDITVHKVSAQKGCNVIYIFLNFVKPIKLSTFSKKSVLLFQHLGQGFDQCSEYEQEARFIVEEISKMLSINQVFSIKLEDSRSILKKFKE